MKSQISRSLSIEKLCRSPDLSHFAHLVFAGESKWGFRRRFHRSSRRRFTYKSIVDSTLDLLFLKSHDNSTRGKLYFACERKDCTISSGANQLTPSTKTTATAALLRRRWARDRKWQFWLDFGINRWKN